MNEEAIERLNRYKTIKTKLELATESEKEVIERMNNFKTIKVLYGNTFAIHLEQLEQLQNDIETVLNLLEKKDKKIEHLEKLNKFQSKDIKEAVDYTFELNSLIYGNAEG